MICEFLFDRVNEYRKGKTPVLYLNAGDTYMGTPWFNIYKDRIVTEFMNLLKPDAIVSAKRVPYTFTQSILCCIIPELGQPRIWRKRWRPSSLFKRCHIPDSGDKSRPAVGSGASANEVVTKLNHHPSAPHQSGHHWVLDAHDQTNHQAKWHWNFGWDSSN